MKLRSLLHAAPLCSLALLLSLPALADTYANRNVLFSDGSMFVAGNDYGDYVILDGQISPPVCAQSLCYVVGNAVTGTSYVTNTVPVLRGSSNPVPGPGCAAVPSEFYGASLCNNGHEILVGNFMSDTLGVNRIFDGDDPATDEIGRGDARGLILSPSGNLFYEDQSNDTLDVLVDVTTLPSAVTPEPPSLCLLGAGFLGLATAMRRRRG